ncbi:hypothetical protein M231_04476 [Tremella mesenterica]|uniref:Transcription factor IIIC putative zinc-finger domain-containing protein n=1 Tax=Tremella mesenterica TaxID=5217 RepID=A0A4Q1BKK5_TREME|nr:hypothetical protein M231_04476 [Tremella mesenterica]
MSWSKAVPLPSTVGLDGSLLAIADRAGYVAFWTYGEDRRFHREYYEQISDDWPSHLAWSDWRQVDDYTCEADLAMSLTDGSVMLLPMQRNFDPEMRRWTLELGEVQSVSTQDKRVLTAIRWIDDLLVWTKSSTVHFWSRTRTPHRQWDGLRQVTLHRIGDWAGANSLFPCIGIQSIADNSILVTLSNLSTHLIEHINTEPTLASPQRVYDLTLSMRDVFLETLGGPYTLQNLDTQSLTASTAGWAGLGGHMAIWASEAINFHNQFTVTEAKRRTVLTLTDFGSALPQGGRSVREQLVQILEGSPRLLDRSPTAIFAPLTLRITAEPRTSGVINTIIETLSARATSIVPTPSMLRRDDLRRLLWSSTELNARRLEVVLLYWLMSFYPERKTDLSKLLSDASRDIDQNFVASLIMWVAPHMEGYQEISPTSKDYQFLRLLVKASYDVIVDMNSLTDDIITISSTTGMGTESERQEVKDLCPVCGEGVEPIEEGYACSKGHEWTRCSVTRFLITQPNYRICLSCPAIALLPDRLIRTPIAIDERGKERDWKRFRTPIDRTRGDWLVQEVLEAAVVCVRCGGRWARTM